MLSQYSPFHLLCHRLLLHQLVWSDDVVTSGARVVLPSGDLTVTIPFVLSDFSQEVLCSFNSLFPLTDVLLIIAVPYSPLFSFWQYTVQYCNSFELLFQFLSCRSTFVTFLDLKRSYSSDMSFLTLLPFRISSFLLTSPFLESFCRTLYRKSHCTERKSSFLKDKGQLSLKYLLCGQRWQLLCLCDLWPAVMRCLLTLLPIIPLINPYVKERFQRISSWHGLHTLLLSSREDRDSNLDSIFKEYPLYLSVCVLHCWYLSFY